MAPHPKPKPHSQLKSEVHSLSNPKPQPPPRLHPRQLHVAGSHREAHLWNEPPPPLRRRQPHVAGSRREARLWNEIFDMILLCLCYHIDMKFIDLRL